MKTISKRFLKASVAMLLVVIMLFGSTISGFAAVVDKADTAGNISNGTVFYFDNVWGLTNNCIQLMVGHGSYSQGYSMTKMDGTSYYRVVMPKWDNCTELAVFGTDGVWGGENNNIAHRKNSAPNSTPVNTTLVKTATASGTYVMIPSTNALAINQLTSYSALNVAQTIEPKLDNASVSAGTVGTFSVTSVSLTNTYVSNATTIGTSRNAAKGSNVEMKVTGVKTGYKFLGWDTNGDNAVDKTGDTYSYTCDGTAKTINALFEKSDVTVTVNAGKGGTITSGSGENTLAQNIGTLDIAASANTGYRFDGWTNTNDGSFENADSESTTYTAGTENDTVTATFTAIEYPITFTLNGGAFADGVNVPANYTIESGEITLPTPSRNGYVFKGWYDNAAFEGTAIEKFTPATGDCVYTGKTYYAKWVETHNIVVSANPENGGTVSINGYDGTSVPVEKGSSVELVATTVDSHNFIGWYLNGELKSEENSYTVENIQSDATYVAKFEIKTFTVNVYSAYSDNGTDYNTGETGGSVVATKKGTTEALTSPITADYGDTFTLTATAENGYRFIGWFVDGSNTPASNTNNKVDTVAITKKKTYEARFIKTYDISVVKPTGINKITYSVNGGAETELQENSLTVDVNSNVTFKAYAIEGECRVTGWTSGETTDTLTIDGVNANVEIVPTVTPLYNVATIVYTNQSENDTTGGTAQADVSKAADTDTVTFTATANSNYEFIGWFEDAEFTTPTANSANPSVTYTMGAGDVTLYALFAKKYYFVYQGDENVTEAKKFTYDEKTGSYSYSPVDVPNFSEVTKVYSRNFGIKTADNKFVDVDEISEKRVYTDGWATFYGTGLRTLGIQDGYENEKLTVTIDKDNVFGVNTRLKNRRMVVVKDSGDSKLLEQAVSVGAEVTLDLSTKLPGGKYINSVSWNTEEGFIDVKKAEVIDGDKIKFTMPADAAEDNKVEFKIVYGQMHQVSFEPDKNITVVKEDYYKPLAPVSITVTPHAGCDVDALTPCTTSGKELSESELKDMGYSATKGDNNVWTVTFANLNQDVLIKVTETVSYKVSAVALDVEIQQNWGVGGTVTMSVNGTTHTNGERVVKDTKVTYTASANTDYDFVGFFTDKDCKHYITNKDTIDYDITEDTTLYALFAHKQYFRAGTSGNGQKMTYDYENRVYTYVYNSTVSSSSLQVYFSKNKSISNEYYNDNNIETITLFDSETTHVVRGSGSSFWASPTKGNYTAPITFYIKPNLIGETANKAYIYAKATSTSKNKVYLSDGVKTAMIDASGDTTINTPASLSITNNNTSLENCVSFNVDDGTMINFTTTISGAKKTQYQVYQFLVYKIESGELDKVEDENVSKGFDTAGNLTYTANYEVEETCYIVPIYTPDFENYEGKVIDVYVNADEVDDMTWGPFVSMYGYGDKSGNYSTEYMGTWPGQLMSIEDDGTYYTAIGIPESSTAHGFVFSNGIDLRGDNSPNALVPAKLATEFGLIQHDIIQTYDYREGITLHGLGMDKITYVLQKGSDGYHNNNNYNSSSGYSDWATKPGESDIANIESSFNFEYLYDDNLKDYMNLNGEKVVDENGNPITEGEADFYIVAKGDQLYAPNNDTYDVKGEYTGEWSVKWYVYYKDGNNGVYLTHNLSDAFYNKYPGDTVTALAKKVLEALKSKGKVGNDTDISYFNDKIVKISYEAPNGCIRGSNTHSMAYDGQWYGDITTEQTFTIDTYVAFADENGVVTSNELNEENGCKAFVLDDETGQKLPNLVVSAEDGAATVLAELGSGYKFLGWSTSKSTNFAFTEVSKLVKFGNDVKYYAVFQKLGEKEISISHTKYVNPNDPIIFSHGGICTMGIEVIEYEGNTDKEINRYTFDQTLSGGSVGFTATEDNTYKVKLITTPLEDGEFFAYYTRAKDVDDVYTFEEVLTTDKNVGQKTEVCGEFSFVYKPGKTPTNYDFFSDVTLFTRDITLKYIYNGRRGETLSFTKKVQIGYEETKGYPGNDENSGYPQFITEYIMTDGHKCYGETDKNAYINSHSGVTEKSSYNRVTANAPKELQTQVFDKRIEWKVDLENVNYTFESPVFTITAIEGKPQYDFTHQIGLDGTSSTKRYYYNELVELDAEAEKDGKVFMYWQDIVEDENGNPVLGDIICYTTFFNYRVTGDRHIVAVYGDKEVVDAAKQWNPKIEDVSYTHEKSDSSDAVYTDFQLAFSSKDLIELSKVYEAENIQYGLIMVRANDYIYKGEAVKSFPDDSEIRAGVIQTAKNGSNTRIIGANDGLKYNAYCYNLTGKSTTNYNRMNYHLRFNILNNDKVKGYTFTCYAYMIVDGEVLISDKPVNSSIWDSANDNVPKA